MKKPIDPNLGGELDDELMPGGEKAAKKEEFGFNDYSRPAAPEPHFDVKDKATGESIDIDAKAKPAAMDPDIDYTEHHHHHHHSEDGEHHHSSSGEHHHHSSSGEHHHHHSSDSSSHHHYSSSSGHYHHHHHHHHHSSIKKKLPLPARIAIGILIAILIFVVVGVGTFLALMLNGNKDLKTKPENTSYQETIEYKGHTYKFNNDVFAIAFMGIDQRDLKTAAQTDFAGASDTDIVVAIDSKTGTTKAISIPRDTMVDVDIYTNSGVFLRTQKSQLCLAYAYGDGGTRSCQSTVDAMSRVLMGVPITKYFALDLDGIKPLNDEIGGVTLTSMYDFSSMGVKKGDRVTLRGDMAETYVRERSMTEIDASLNRNQRQIQYIKAYVSQLVPAAMKDFGIVNQLYNTASKYSQTNISLSNATYTGTLLLSHGVTDFQTTTLSGEMKASKDKELADVVHAEFYPDEDSVTQAVLDAFYTRIN